MLKRGARSRLARLVLAAAVLTGVSAACDSDDKVADGEDRTETEAGSAQAADTPTAEVTAVDYRYEGVDDSIATGTELTLTNASAGEVHELVAIHLPDEETRGAEELLALPEEEQQTIGEFVGVVVAMPGEDGFAPAGPLVLTGAGRYLLFCAIPTGADPAEYQQAVQEATDGPPDVDGGPPHFTAGMFAEVTVA